MWNYKTVQKSEEATDIICRSYYIINGTTAEEIKKRIT